MTQLSITSPASKLSQLFDTTLFGSTPQFTDNWLAFNPDHVLIADLSMNALIIYGTFAKSNFANYEVPEPFNFTVTSDLQKIYKKTFNPTDEVGFVVDGLEFKMTSSTRDLTDQLKKASAPHVTPDKFPTKIIHDEKYGPVMEKVHAKLADFNKIQIDSSALSALPDTTASDYLFKVTKENFIINQESADSTWKLNEQLKMLQQEYTSDLTVKVTKNNFNTALSLHSGPVWLLCAPTIIVITSQSPDHQLMTAVGTKKTQSTAKPSAPIPPPVVTKS